MVREQLENTVLLIIMGAIFLGVLFFMLVISTAPLATAALLIQSVAAATIAVSAVAAYGRETGRHESHLAIAEVTATLHEAPDGQATVELERHIASHSATNAVISPFDTYLKVPDDDGRAISFPVHGLRPTQAPHGSSGERAGSSIISSIGPHDVLGVRATVPLRGDNLRTRITANMVGDAWLFLAPTNGTGNHRIVSLQRPAPPSEPPHIEPKKGLETDRPIMKPSELPAPHPAHGGQERKAAIVVDQPGGRPHTFLRNKVWFLTRGSDAALPVPIP